MDSSVRLANTIRSKANRRSGSVYGIWVAAETADSKLSQVLIPGSGLGGEDAVARFIPKAAHVTGLTPDATVLMVGSPLCIVAVVEGDISLAAI